MGYTLIALLTGVFGMAWVFDRFKDWDERLVLGLCVCFGAMLWPLTATIGIIAGAGYLLHRTYRSKSFQQTLSDIKQQQLGP